MAPATELSPLTPSLKETTMKTTQCKECEEPAVVLTLSKEDEIDDVVNGNSGDMEEFILDHDESAEDGKEYIVSGYCSFECISNHVEFLRKMTSSSYD
jgi:hypothetical protein